MDGDAERTSTQNFLEGLTEASAFQRIEMALKPQNDRDMKGLEGSNLPLSPSSLAVEAISGEQREIAAFAARFEPQPNQRGRISASFDAVRCFSPRGHRLVRFRNCFG
jgi:hypothetical protein